ncbi:MAG TPA: glycosyltransferase family 2 protein [Actinomycetota bacterium]|nr:glycosyltransferase family 2 protein [Actinomycetota bacterium]
MTRVVAIVPAYQEAGRVAPAVTALKEFCDRIIVVDDGSTDATADEAAAAGARVIRSSRNRGKGSALAAGIRAAGADAQVLLLADADLASSASTLRALLRPVVDGEADLTIAAPPPSGPSGFGLVESLARHGIKALARLDTTRPLSGQRAIRADLASRLRLDRRFGVETGMTIDAVRLGARVVEVPCAFTHARTGRDLAGFAHRAKQGLGVGRAVLRRLPGLLRRPPKRGNVAS